MTSLTDSITATMVPSAQANWSPAVGPELRKLLEAKLKDAAARKAVQESTLRILARCINPHEPQDEPRTGLVVGYVQSGKTLSFTSVAAAASDNGFRTVAVIAGSSLNLADQNKDRLAADLDLSAGFHRPWARQHNPTTSNLEGLRTSLAGWKHGRGKTLLLTALKHHRHVENLGRVLEALGEVAAPVLLIDDEADQISLNTLVNKGDESANYSQILQLRGKAKRHTYLQYTATPQANIFIPLWDQLSPDFGETLDPGPGYVGGKRFFIERSSDLVRVIDDQDLAMLEEAGEAPPSFHEAMRVFFLGVAQGLLDFLDSGALPAQLNRSMMVHPSRLVNSHQIFASWARAARDAWQVLLQDDTDPDRKQLVSDFANTYEDLQGSNRSGTLAPFDRLLAILPRCIAEVEVREVNAGNQTDWPKAWKERYAWILVGGQNLDRGFTVEGLSVTYMPRDVGTGQADTIQQRARFFGYKSEYEDLCRVYLGKDARRAFEVYVRHEASMRDFLRRNRDRLGDPCIVREFELDAALKPTRTQVLVDNPTRYTLKKGWLQQDFPLARIDRSRRNGELLDAFIAVRGRPSAAAEGPWVLDQARVRDTHRHSVLPSIPLRELYEGLLVDLVLDASEHTEWQVALSMISNAIDEHDDLVGTIVLMRPESTPFRGIEESGKVKQLFGGAYPNERPYAYAGDRDVRVADVTLQYHRFDLGIGADSDEGDPREVKESAVPTLALWLGDRVNRPMIRQDQVAS